MGGGTGTGNTAARIFEIVSDTLQESLDIEEEEEISLDKSIVVDLNAESIDFLDIVFRLEKKLNIKFKRNMIFPDSISDSNIHDTLTKEVLEGLQSKMPFGTKLDYVTPGKSTVGELFTVRLICQAVAYRLEIPWVDPVV